MHMIIISFANKFPNSLERISTNVVISIVPIFSRLFHAISIAFAKSMPQNKKIKIENWKTMKNAIK